MHALQFEQRQTGKEYGVKPPPAIIKNPDTSLAMLEMVRRGERRDGTLVNSLSIQEEIE